MKRGKETLEYLHTRVLPKSKLSTLQTSCQGILSILIEIFMKTQSIYFRTS